VTGRPLRSPEGGFLLHRVRAPLAIAALAALLAGCGASVVPQIMNDSSRVPLARKLYEKHDYALAVDVLSAYAQAGAGNADIDQAIYLLGLTYLGQRDWASAQVQFERVLRDYPESDSAAAASYRLGEAMFGQSRSSDFDQEYTLKALAQWEQFVKGSPDHPFVPDANERIAQCRARLARKLWRTGDVYYKQAYYEPAKRYFQSVIDEYADTPVYGDALIGMAMTNARLGMKDSALAVLRGLEEEFKGKPLGDQAAQVRAKVQHWPAEGDRRRHRNRPVEAPAAPQLPTAPTTTGGISGAP
jgi:outer membrane protein assembly factor BamD